MAERGEISTAPVIPIQERAMADKVLQLDSKDNVLIALTDLKKGEQVEFSGRSYSLSSNVPAKHKFATEDLQPGASVVMYGVLVGKAVKPIPKGGLLSLNNIHHEAAPFHEKSGDFHWRAPDVSKWSDWGSRWQKDERSGCWR